MDSGAVGVVGVDVDRRISMLAGALPVFPARLALRLVLAVMFWGGLACRGPVTRPGAPR